jgi:hypothetical protein
MRKSIFILLLIGLLVGCGLSPAQRLPKEAPSTIPYTQCAWNWASENLPELSARVEAGMQAAGLKDVNVRAEAYGENCITGAGKVDHFAALQTDFHITAKIANLADTKDAGATLEKILIVLDTFPPGQLPGSQPGIINLFFQGDSAELYMTFSVTAGKNARTEGYHDAALFNKLQKK